MHPWRKMSLQALLLVPGLLVNTSLCQSSAVRSRLAASFFRIMSSIGVATVPLIALHVCYQFAYCGPSRSENPLSLFSPCRTVQYCVPDCVLLVAGIVHARRAIYLSYAM